MTLFAQQKQNPPKSTAWQLWKIFPSATVRQEPEHEARLSVRLIRPTHRAAGTPVETQIVSILAREGAMSYENLVQRVADELYRKELRHGGGALDIGLFGSRLFDRDVVSALEAGDGVIWEIS
ncbi:MAG: hypothetical protein ACREQO_14135 [Candidatus Binatia bacterium]